MPCSLAGAGGHGTARPMRDLFMLAIHLLVGTNCHSVGSRDMAKILSSLDPILALQACPSLPARRHCTMPFPAIADHAGCQLFNPYLEFLRSTSAASSKAKRSSACQSVYSWSREVSVVAPARLAMKRITRRTIAPYCR